MVLWYGRLFRDTDNQLKTDLVDMEAHTFAKIFYSKDIKFRCFKYISNNIDEVANDDWIKNVFMVKKLFIKRIRDLEIY